MRIFALSYVLLGTGGDDNCNHAAVKLEILQLLIYGHLPCLSVRVRRFHRNQRATRGKFRAKSISRSAAACATTVRIEAGLYLEPHGFRTGIHHIDAKSCGRAGVEQGCGLVSG